MVLGSALRHDASYKAAAHVYCDGTRPYVCTFSCMNEFNQILGYWNCTSSSLSKVPYLHVLHLGDDFRPYQ
jgi:hypothetical protein